MTVHKFGEGNVARDPQDPQGVPVVEGASRVATSQQPGELDRDLQEENERADSEPATEISGR